MVTSSQQTLTVGHALEIARLLVPDRECEGKRSARDKGVRYLFVLTVFLLP
jgi:hypothetical protein